MGDCEAMFKHENSFRTIAAILVDAVLCSTPQLLHTGSGIPGSGMLLIL